MSSDGDSWVFSRHGSQDFVTWIFKFDIVLQRLRSWMDLLPEVTSADISPEFAPAFLPRLQDPTEQATYAEQQFREWNRQREDAHMRSFPLNDNLRSLLFLVQSDLNEHQRERLVTNQGCRIETYTCNVVRQTMFEQFATTKAGLQDPNMRRSSHKKDRRGRRYTHRRRGGCNFRILDLHR